MVKITYENFKDLECEYVKYVSQIKGNLMLHIIDFKKFQQKLLEEYTEDEIQYFFKILPYTLDSEVNEEIIHFVVRQEIAYYKDLQLIEVNGKDYVLVDESSESMEEWYLLDRIKSQPIPFEEFIKIGFDDFVGIDTWGLLLGVESNVKERNKKEGKPKYVDTALESVYI